MFFQTAGLPPLTPMHFERERRVMVPGSLGDSQVIDVADTARREPSSELSIATVNPPWYKTKWFAVVAVVVVVLLVVLLWYLMKKLDTVTRRMNAGAVVSDRRLLP